MAQNLVGGMLLKVRMVAFEGTNQQLGVNVCHYRVVSVAGGAVRDLDVAAFMDTALAAVYKAWMNANASYHGMGVQIIKPLQYLEVAGTGNAGAGGGAGNMLPNQVSGLIREATAQSGRNYRGRVYPPFPSAGLASANGDLIGAGLTLLQNIAAAWPINPTVTNGGANALLQCCLLHRAPPALAGTTTDVLSFTAFNGFATQRRRGQLGRTNVAPF